MASTAEISAVILEPMRALYRTPHGVESVEDALGEYAKVLKRWTIDELELGWEFAVAKHKRRDWPSIYELQEWMRAAAPSPPRPSRLSSYSAVDEPDNRTPESKDRVRRMFAVLDKHKFSETQFTDTSNDPEYLAICAEIDASALPARTR
jgi:hypothetical protein